MSSTMSVPDPSKALRIASTVLLLREAGGGMEIFMVQRNRQIEFSSGALVFPGGSMDLNDREVAADPALGGSQVHRFLILHKELDPDDGEITRTRKVRRGFIADKYDVLIAALYGGKSECFVETQVKFEDGRTGTISATLRIAEAQTYNIDAAKRAA